MPDVAFATCLTLPEPDNDEQLFLSAARSAGIHAEMAAWDDPSVDWSSYSLVVLRSTWNYYEAPEEFANWVRHVDSKTRLLNPAPLMLGNIHKRYRIHLADQGVPIVPTLMFAQGAQPNLARLLGETGWSKFVVKPAISASSFMTHVFSAHGAIEAEGFLIDALRERDMMVQEFMPSVADGGEIALVHISGELTHGIIKHPRLAGQEESTSEAVDATGEQRLAAARILATIPKPWLYARVDLMLNPRGEWLLSELELIEPSLFLCQKPEALERFIEGVASYAPGNPPPPARSTPRSVTTRLG